MAMKFLDAIHIDNFEGEIPIADWAQMNKLSNEQNGEYKYLGNSFGDNRSVYAVFVNYTADIKRVAVMIRK